MPLEPEPIRLEQMAAPPSLTPIHKPSMPDQAKPTVRRAKIAEAVRRIGNEDLQSLPMYAIVSLFPQGTNPSSVKSRVYYELRRRQLSRSAGRSTTVLRARITPEPAERGWIAAQQLPTFPVRRPVEVQATTLTKDGERLLQSKRVVEYLLQIAGTSSPVREKLFELLSYYKAALPELGNDATIDTNDAFSIRNIMYSLLDQEKPTIHIADSKLTTYAVQVEKWIESNRSFIQKCLLGKV